MVSHDTPIIVQGGSLSIWSANPFAYQSKRTLIVHAGAPLKYLFLANDPGLPDLDAHSPALVLPATDNWEFCTGAPQNLQYRQNGSSLTIEQADTTHPDDGFSPEPAGSGRYAYGNRHSQEAGFGGLYFSPSHEACSAVVTETATCQGTPSGPCRVSPPHAGPMSEKVFIVFSTK